MTQRNINSNRVENTQWLLKTAKWIFKPTAPDQSEAASGPRNHAYLKIPASYVSFLRRLLFVYAALPWFSAADMVHVYNCHPLASQHIVAAEQEPALVCCGGGALFVVSAGGCKVEAYSLQREGCPLICRFSCMGSVLCIRHSAVGQSSSGKQVPRSLEKIGRHFSIPFKLKEYLQVHDTFF